MNAHILILALLAATMLAACAEEPAQPRMSYGPPRSFPHMAPGSGLENADDGAGWTPTNENYRSSTPPPFKGF